MNDPTIRFQELFYEGNEKFLKQLCVKYYQLKNEYADKQQEPPPNEIAQRLCLHPEEYSILLNFLNDGGYNALIDNEIAEELNNGATFIGD